MQVSRGTFLWITGISHLDLSSLCVSSKTTWLFWRFATSCASWAGDLFIAKLEQWWRLYNGLYVMFTIRAAKSLQSCTWVDVIQHWHKYCIVIFQFEGWNLDHQHVTFAETNQRKSIMHQILLFLLLKVFGKSDANSSMSSLTVQNLCFWHENQSTGQRRANFSKLKILDQIVPLTPLLIINLW